MSTNRTDTSLRQVRDEALVTYRTLRVALLGAVALLGVSVLITMVRDEDVLGSISAYFHTTTRSVFVGSLIAIGMSVVAVRGSDDEELFLNIAGMLAPVVALVPVAPPGSDVLPDDMVAGVRNNLGAFLAIGLIALLVLRLWPSDDQADPVKRTALSRALLVYTAVVVAGGAAFVFWDASRSRLHYVAAVLMFICFGIVALRNWRASGDGRFRPTYRIVTLGMAAAGIVIGGYKVFSELIETGLPEWHTSVLVLEVVEILLFAAFWLAQTIEHWDQLDIEA